MRIKNWKTHIEILKIQYKTLRIKRHDLRLLIKRLTERIEYAKNKLKPKSEDKTNENKKRSVYAGTVALPRKS